MAKLRRGRDTEGDMPGQDSFLDIVSNIVGILILLVMVMGVRASYVSNDEEPAAEASAVASVETAPDAEELYRAAAVSAHDVNEMVQRAYAARKEAQFRDYERQLLNTYVVGFEQEIEARRAELDSEQQQEFDLRRQLQEANETLDDLTREQVSLISLADDAEEVEVRPNPIVNTSSENAIFLSLAGGYVSIVPLEELHELFKEKLQGSMREFKNSDEVIVRVGPIDNFRLQYLMRKSEAVLRNGSGRVGQLIQSVRGLVLPVNSPAGVPVEDALYPDSDLSRLLADHPPETTAINIWLYPDSFGEYHELNRALQSQGYLIATMPLGADDPIAISPNGLSPAAQ